MILDQHNRPLVVFDAANPQHRELYRQFVITGSWKDCPFRFEARDGDGSNNYAATMQRLLVQHYLQQEFGGAANSSAVQ